MVLLLLTGATAASAEDGYDLWLRYRLVEPKWRGTYGAKATAVVEDSRSPTLEAAERELRRGISGLLGTSPGTRLKDGAIVLSTHQPSGTGEGYCIQSTRIGGHQVTLISGNRDIGVLYGAFELLRLIQTRTLPARVDVCDLPKIPIRVLDHWDNLDGTIERGYAGRSLWNWERLPTIDPRLIDYARANASIGINGAVLNNVNADARILTPEYLRKVAAIADAWRPYNIRVYLSARFSAPMEIGGLQTADPLDPGVRDWWRAKIDEIHRLIPDFGGFVVKANAEGQPGPQTYTRTHADGANMLADALAAHHGIVFWRAFVYSDASEEDRAKQAYDEFKPLDGKFRSNVILQIKNGPIDFQPSEPFHPLFGAMGRTRLAIEVQISKEYLGESTHLAYLGTMWSEVLRSRTARPQQGSRVVDLLSAIAGVANVGSERNWTGSDFDQANWYAFGRLAWNPSDDPGRIADQWVRMTWSNDPRVVKPVVAIMMKSRQAVVDTMTPLGLAHQMASDHHYGPGPWVSDLAEPLWNPTYYNRADSSGIGFNRTSTGSKAVAQYAPSVGRCFADLVCVSDDDLLWFHHLPWTYRVKSGRTLWAELIHRYDRGLSVIASMGLEWRALRPFIDAARFNFVSAKLGRQSLEAKWWRDASIAYFQSVSHLPLPAGTRPPDHDLHWYEAIHFDTVPGFLSPGIWSAIVLRST